MKDGPEGKHSCPCPEFSKEGLCDWPYAVGSNSNQGTINELAAKVLLEEQGDE